MLVIAMVEDERDDLDLLSGYIQRFSRENNIKTQLLPYRNGADFLARYPEKVDLLFLDIEMDKINGIDTARQIRTFDRKVVVVFVTNLFQYALEGYEVNALDFLVKPVRYSGFCTTMRKILGAIESEQAKYIEVPFNKTSRYVEVKNIFYIETNRKKVLLRTKTGDVNCNLSMHTMEKRLIGYGFRSCHQSFLVNFAYIDALNANSVVVHGVELPISRYKKQEFINGFVRYAGETL